MTSAEAGAERAREMGVRISDETAMAAARILFATERGAA